MRSRWLRAGSFSASALVTVFLTWGLVVAVVGALLAGMMNQLTRSLWTAFLVWWNA